MPIHFKPFNPNDRITAPKFLGRPAYFNAQDLNRAFEVHRQAIQYAQRLSGYATTATFDLANLSYTNNTLTFRLTIGTGELYGPIATQQIPARVLNYTGTKTPTTYNSGKVASPGAVYAVLRWSEVLKTFADDPVMCGITSDEYPTSVPSTDHYVLSNATVSLEDDPSEAGGNYVILYTVLPRPNLAGTGWEYFGFQNARQPKGPGVTEDATHVPEQFYSNNSVLEEMELLRSTISRTLNLQGILDSIQQNGSAIAKLWSYKEELPVGTVLMYSGSLTNFNSTGLGLGVWAGWALLNGQNGTQYDVSGRFIMALDKNQATTPQDATTAQQQNGGLIGNTGGQNAVSLTGPEGPSHYHEFAYNDRPARYDRANPTITFESGRSSNAVQDRGYITQTASSGSGQAHENRPMYAVLAYVVKIARGQYSEQALVSGNGSGDGSGAGTGAYIAQGRAAGKAQALTGAAANNACPTGVTGADCTDYQTGYAAGYAEGNTLYTQNYQPGYTAGKNRAITGAQSAAFCPVNVTGEACTVYLNGYNTAYSAWYPVWNQGYSDGYSDGYAQRSQTPAPPSGYTADEVTVYTNSYNAAYNNGYQDYLSDNGM